MGVLEELRWVAQTVWMEAGGEPEEGKRGVAWVIRNRLRPDRNWVATVLAPLQFSCWNGNSPTRGRLPSCEQDVAWLPSVRAACGAYFGLDTDPTNGATHYCTTTLIGSPQQPDWYDATRVTATLGRHVFLKLP